MLFVTGDVAANEFDVEMKKLGNYQLYKADSKQNPVLYDGPRDYRSILDWLGEQSSYLWKDDKEIDL